MSTTRTRESIIPSRLQQTKANVKGPWPRTSRSEAPGRRRGQQPWRARQQGHPRRALRPSCRGPCAKCGAESIHENTFPVSRYGGLGNLGRFTQLTPRGDGLAHCGCARERLPRSLAPAYGRFLLRPSAGRAFAASAAHGQPARRGRPDLGSTREGGGREGLRGGGEGKGENGTAHAGSVTGMACAQA